MLGTVIHAPGDIRVETVEEVGDAVTTIRPGKTVAVVGDGAVGLLGVLAAKELGAERTERPAIEQRRTTE